MRQTRPTSGTVAIPKVLSSPSSFNLVNRRPDRSSTHEFDVSSLINEDFGTLVATQVEAEMFAGLEGRKQKSNKRKSRRVTSFVCQSRVDATNLNFLAVADEHGPAVNPYPLHFQPPFHDLPPYYVAHSSQDLSTRASVDGSLSSLSPSTSPGAPSSLEYPPNGDYTADSPVSPPGEQSQNGASGVHRTCRPYHHARIRQIKNCPLQISFILRNTWLRYHGGLGANLGTTPPTGSPAIPFIRLLMGRLWKVFL
ncbi:hypothetical protein C8J56DRAFT_48394 [Mycena floridula]|nr:hypothetical protein C8J56DRAFT_48394 [Mycena floridula]